MKYTVITMGKKEIKIKYTLSPNPSKEYTTDADSIIFGRKPRTGEYIDVDLRPDGYVSHVHAILSRENHDYWIEDLNSENGTWVDDKKIEYKTKLERESRIRLGWTIIEIEREDYQAPGAMYPIEEVSEETIINGFPLDSPPELDFQQSEKKLSPVSEELPEIDITIIKEDVVEKLSEPTSGGTITSIKNALTPPFANPEADNVDDSQKKTWSQLKVLNDFIQALNNETTIEGLGNTLVRELKKAIPQAQRGALLLPDKNCELLLKAHWPSGEHSVSMTFVNRAFSKQEAFMWNASEQWDSEDPKNAPKSALYYEVQSAIYLPLFSTGESLGVMYVDNYLNRDAFSPTDFELLRAIANQVGMFLRDHVLREDLQKEEELRSNLMRQYSPKIANRILEKCVNLQRGGEKVNPVTILVSDVRGFTALSATMEPDDVVRAINEMFDAFVPIISERDGVIDKFVGDSLLAVFGSPEHDDRQWEKAIKAAVKMQEAMLMLGQGRKVRHLPVFTVGIGIHTGEVIHGFIGSSERIEFTVIGDTVNRAARLCDGANPGQIIISKKVFERVYNLVDVQPKKIITKHPDKEPDLEAYIVKGLKDIGSIAQA